MNDSDIIADLKQFIAASILQQTADLQEAIIGLKGNVTVIKSDVSSLKDDVTGIKGDVTSLKDDVRRVEDKIDDLSSAVADAIDTSNEATHGQLTNHEVRIGKLERKSA